MALAPPRPTPPSSSFRSIADLWHHRVHSTPDLEAMSYRVAGEWTSITWRQAGERVRRIANGLLASGLEPESRVCIICETRVEWVLADLAIVCAGGATTTIYPSTPAEDCRFILDDSGTVAVFAENDAQVAKLTSQRDQLPLVQMVVVIDGKPSADGWVRTLASLEAEGDRHAEEHPDAYNNAADSIDPGRMATLIYTSGTTGRPKGVVLTHDCWVYESEAIDRMGIISAADKQFLFLPLSHVFAKAMMILFVRLGVPTAIDGDQDDLPDNLAATRPTWMAAVPRVFEKAQNRIMNEIKDASGLRKGAFQWALRVGEDVSKARQQHREPDRLLRLRYRVAERLVFHKVHAMFGGRMRFMLSGGAPLSPDIARFFHACGILILEGYGLTESSAASCVNTPDSFVFGTVGCPLPGTEVKLSEEGEILLKSRGNMLGYYNLPELSAEAFTDDGWLRTGDIGAVLDTGHLKITGRIKDLIITAGGKNIAPSNFQNLLKASSNYVSQALVHGDKRSYCVALVTIDEGHVREWARERGIQASTYSQLAENESVKALIWEAVDAVNKQLPSYETVKRIHLCSQEWTVANGCLTPSLKVKRRVVEEGCADVLDAFYAGTVHKM